MRNIKLIAAISSVGLALSVVACGDDDDTSPGEGEVSFNIYGEDFIEKEIPAEEVEDGWAIQFNRFVVSIGSVHLKGDHHTEELSGPWLIDLTKPGPQALGFVGQIPAGRYSQVGYSIIPADKEYQFLSGVSSDDAAQMLSEGYSVHVAGVATKGDESKRFSWGFKSKNEYDHCTAVDASGKDLPPGIILASGGKEDVQLTIHGDHLFYDDLAADNAVLRFNAIASADADADGEITREELSQVALFDLTEGSYGTGNFSDITSLDDFINALVRNIGHFRGEGHCSAR